MPNKELEWTFDPATRCRESPLGRQMHHDIRLELSKNSFHLFAITDVRLHEVISLRISDIRQGFEVTGVGQRIEVDNSMLSGSNQFTDNRGADKAGTACN